MKVMQQYFFIVLIAIGLLACGTQPHTVTHKFDNGQIITLDSNQSGSFITMNAVPAGYVMHMNVQDNVSGQMAKNVDLQEGVITFVPLAPGEYQITGHGNNGIIECWVHGVLFQVVEGNVTEVNLSGTCHDLPSATGANVNVTLEMLPNIYVTLNAASPSGLVAPSTNTKLMRFNVRHDGTGDVAIPGVQVHINYDTATTYYVGNCHIERDGVTVFDSYVWNDGDGNYVIQGTQQIVPAGVTIVLDMVCDTTANQSSYLQAEVWSLDGPHGYYAYPMPIVGNVLTF